MRKSIAILAAATSLALTAAAAVAAEPAPTVVLVHGAFADGSSWSKVIPLLRAKGLNVVAVQNPLTSLAEDVAAAKRAIDVQQGPVILVGHSWGGAVITEAGNDDKVKALVYVAAFAPDGGQSINDMTKPFPPAPWTAKLQMKDGFLTLPEETVLSDFAQDLLPEQGKIVASVQGPWAARCLDDKVTTAAWSGKPTWFVKAENDHMIPPQFQDMMAKHIGAHVVDVKSSHVAMLSHPKEVASAIVAAAKSVE